MIEHNAYRIIKTSAEIKVNPLRRLDGLKPGCTLDDECPEVVKSFESLDAALDALKAYEAEIRFFHAAPGLYASVTEYSVEAYVADEDGNFIEGSDYYPCEWPDAKEED